ncbi:hypothetical protein E6O75_ATG10449 [Venturia nashicola]|uniref:Uncharacterized protein n=1 Tax=Venturia nashicola TaxID=86259 RepID=A0A4Z1P1U3_9PEZI|nr:hypothetical protein E6O75_ATG10449 [Venturia nashicola]
MPYASSNEPLLENEERQSTSSNKPETETLLTPSDSVIRREKASIFYIFTIFLLSGIIVFQIFALPHQSQKKPTGREFGGCGSNIAEARALGCHFDVMTWQWVPEQCYFTDLIESFMLRADWHFYHNYTLESADEIDMGEILAGDHELVYTPDWYHPIHCTYMWMKLHQAYLEKRPIDDINSQMDHSLHCAKNILNPYTNELGAGNCTGEVCAARLLVTFGHCGYH